MPPPKDIRRYPIEAYAKAFDEAVRLGRAFRGPLPRGEAINQTQYLYSFRKLALELSLKRSPAELAALGISGVDSWLSIRIKQKKAPKAEAAEASEAEASDSVYLVFESFHFDIFGESSPPLPIVPLPPEDDISDLSFDFLSLAEADRFELLTTIPNPQGKRVAWLAAQATILSERTKRPPPLTIERSPTHNPIEGPAPFSHVRPVGDVGEKPYPLFLPIEEDLETIVLRPEAFNRDGTRRVPLNDDSQPRWWPGLGNLTSSRAAIFGPSILDRFERIPVTWSTYEDMPWPPPEPAEPSKPADQ